MSDQKYLLNTENQFEDKVVIVTGSTQGSGAETAKLFANRGAKGITICGRSEDQGNEIKKEIENTAKYILYSKHLSTRFINLRMPLLNNIQY